MSELNYLIIIMQANKNRPTKRPASSSLTKEEESTASTETMQIITPKKKSNSRSSLTTALISSSSSSSLTLLSSSSSTTIKTTTSEQQSMARMVSVLSIVLAVACLLVMSGQRPTMAKPLASQQQSRQLDEANKYEFMNEAELNPSGPIEGQQQQQQQQHEVDERRQQEASSISGSGGDDDEKTTTIQLGDGSGVDGGDDEGQDGQDDSPSASYERPSLAEESLLHQQLINGNNNNRRKRIRLEMDDGSHLLGVNNHEGDNQRSTSERRSSRHHKSDQENSSDDNSDLGPINGFGPDNNNEEHEKNMNSDLTGDTGNESESGGSGGLSPSASQESADQLVDELGASEGVQNRGEAGENDNDNDNENDGAVGAPSNDGLESAEDSDGISSLRQGDDEPEIKRRPMAASNHQQRRHEPINTSYLGERGAPIHSSNSSPRKKTTIGGNTRGQSGLIRNRSRDPMSAIVDRGEEQEPIEYAAASKNHQHRRLTNTDLKAAASGHHHGHGHGHGHGVHGWLDMGAHSGKKGAFGWHDKHPVGGKGK